MSKVVLRVIGVLPAFAIQVLWMVVLLKWLAPWAALINLVLSLFAILFVLYIMSSRNEGSYKTLWLLVILGLPVFGAILYLIFGNKRTTKPIRRRLERSREQLPPHEIDTQALHEVEEERPRLAQTFHYIQKITGFSPRPCRDTTYYSLGEYMFEAMLKDLETAEHFIFAEYFIVENGKMWDSMVEIMSRKAAEGVDVRFMYDDMGSIFTYTYRNLKQLEEKGIKCVRFNALKSIRGTLNYRDHRKMLIIDGKVVFSGGANLADEYINEVVKFGHWKDIGFRLTGEPVREYTRMFVHFWNAYSKEPVSMDVLVPPELPPYTGPDNGCVLSYYDSPMYDDAASNKLYVELLGQATHYAWFYTPYLMLGETLMDAFVRAAQRGVDVRIIVPGIPDKKLVFRITRSYYQPLLEMGVKIYEYTPGFVHAKGCVIDDVVGTMGTVNLDFRSLYFHFENNALFYRASVLSDLKADFQATQEKCQERTLENIGSGFGKWFVDGVMRIFAPLC